MNWDDCRYFLALARHGSAASVAKKFRVSHSTVTRRIAVFEKDLGCRLFDKIPTGHRLTREGEAIVPLAEEIEVSVKSIYERAAGKDDELAGRVRLTLPESVLLPLLSDKLPAFRSLHPKIDLELKVQDSVLNIRNREADIAVRMSDAPEEYLVGRKMAPVGYSIYGKKGHQSADWVLWSHEDTVPSLLSDQLPGREVALNVDSMLAKVAAVKAGCGIAELPCFIGDQESDLERLSMPIIHPDWHLWVLTHEDLVKTQRMRCVLDWLYKVLSQEKSLIEGAR